MNLPVPVESTKPECLICVAVNRHCDQALSDLSAAMKADGGETHVITAMLRWVITQAIAQTDGNVPQIIAEVAATLNEPQNERVVHAFMERSGKEPAVPRGVVH